MTKVTVTPCCQEVAVHYWPDRTHAKFTVQFPDYRGWVSMVLEIDDKEELNIIL
jgi:hypothetical protein